MDTPEENEVTSEWMFKFGMTDVLNEYLGLHPDTKPTKDLVNALYKRTFSKANEKPLRDELIRIQKLPDDWWNSEQDDSGSPTR